MLFRSALLWAIKKGYKNIRLLGYDCSIRNGFHWHGEHDQEKGLSNPGIRKVEKWHDQFTKVYFEAARTSVNIINCSRYTELVCFPCATLEEVLQIDKKRRLLNVS